RVPAAVVVVGRASACQRPLAGRCLSGTSIATFGAICITHGSTDKDPHDVVQIKCRNAADARPKANDAANPPASTSVPRITKSAHVIVLLLASSPSRSFAKSAPGPWRQDWPPKGPAAPPPSLPR